MIIDTHQHFWHIGEGDAKGPEDYKIKAIPEGITGTILRLHETQWCLDLAAQEPLIVGVCGAIQSGPDFEKELERFSANPLFRGICYSGRDIEDVEKGSLLSDMQLLADKDLELDLLRAIPTFFGGPKIMQRYKGTPASMEGVFKIAERVPKLRIVIEHIGGMAIDGKQTTKEWEAIYKRLAEYPQISIKVSGLMERATTRPENERATELLSFYRPALDTLWDIFGEDRLFYASNWPVCEHVGDFITNGLRIVRPYFAEKGDEAYNKFFWKNSKKVYKWVPRLPSQQ
ncbi:MAG: amidohydrolase family protein [Thermincola sp.]|jgi:predicted TIM-barrel fold metal-dependent hydrolase|nr:amidohydrolase family protein [Thermincola sp.]MDT3704594.1 amidohydrolase family protein [Thermincola sp.]